VINVDTTTTAKILMLPTSSTIQGIPLIIRDSAGMTNANSTIWISTQRFDLMDGYASTIQLTNGYQSFKVVPYSTTRYAITLNYTNGLTPFAYAISVGYVYTQRESSRNWGALASNSSGTVLAAAVGYLSGEIYVSTDSGVTWGVQTALNKQWAGIAMSSSGSAMVASVYNGYLYTSSNTGSTWTQRDSVRNWGAVASSSNGTILLASTNHTFSGSDFLYLSTNSGVSWSSIGSSLAYISCAMSSNGSIMYATTYSGKIYVSTDTGTTWTPRDSDRFWGGVCCSSDGVTAYATSGNNIYKTTNSGTSWTLVNSDSGNRGPACSSDGSIVLGASLSGGLGPLRLSSNGGTSFSDSGASRFWGSLCLNASGSQVLAAVNPGFLFTGQLAIL
jgi:hypothetical protein